MQRGVSFVPPRTPLRGLAPDRCSSSAAPPTARADRRREIRAVQDDMARRRGDAARVIEGLETTGYGSSATWKGGRS